MHPNIALQAGYSLLSGMWKKRVLTKGRYISDSGYERRTDLMENAAAVEIKLTPSEVAELETTVPMGPIVGRRYSPGSSANDRPLIVFQAKIQRLPTCRGSFRPQWNLEA